MSAPPYMKLFWGDYHKATRHLTRDQHGAYFLLLGEAWRLGGSLPNDDELLARWTLSTADEWAAMRPTIVSFFSLRRGRLVHSRVCEELARYESISGKRKTAGKIGGKASRGKTNEIPEAIANQKPTKPEPESEPEREKEEGSNDPSEKEGETKLDKSGRPRTHTCPTDWEPSEKTLDLGRTLGLLDEEVSLELANMRDHTFRDLRSDWNQTADTWLRNVKKRKLEHGRILPFPSRAEAAAAARHQNHLNAVEGARRAAARIGRSEFD